MGEEEEEEEEAFLPLLPSSSSSSSFSTSAIKLDFAQNVYGHVEQQTKETGQATLAGHQEVSTWDGGDPSCCRRFFYC